MKNLLSLIVTTAVILPVSANALADSAEVPPFAMTVLIDQAHGTKIVNGSFERAINKLANSSKTPNRHENLTNLCVAYAKSKEIDKALRSCDAAIDLLQTRIAQHDGRRSSKKENRQLLQSDLSIALSNRGVLFAVKGDLDRAREYFQAAIDLPINRSQADDNMQRLAAIKS